MDIVRKLGHGLPALIVLLALPIVHMPGARRGSSDSVIPTAQGHSVEYAHD
jgi:hypothetical protein